MKKIILVLIALFMITGCDNDLFNTPTKKVEMFFSRYQSLDNMVLEQLKEVTDDNLSFTEEQKEKYIAIMKRHYQSLKYTVNDEKLDGDTATVTVTIEVMDYSKILKDSEKYLNDHPEEFMDDNGEYSEVLYNNYRLKQLEKVDETVKYTIDLTLTDLDDVWVLDDLSKENQDKIQGIYKY